MKYKEWKCKEYEFKEKDEFIKHRPRTRRKSKHLAEWDQQYEDYVSEGEFDIYDKNYEKELEKYKRIKEETEQWFLDSLY